MTLSTWRKRLKMDPSSKALGALSNLHNNTQKRHLSKLEHMRNVDRPSSSGVGRSSKGSVDPRAVRRH